MKARNPLPQRRGFTLLELLTVIAIITLLIGILVPSLSAARNQAKKTATQGLIRGIETGCLQFQVDNDRLPQSRGKNPFEADSANIYLTGSQWLVLQVSGVDYGGYVKPVLQHDSNADNKIDSMDWLDWYSLSPKRTYTRSSAYVQADSKSAASPNKLITENTEITAIPAAMQGSNEGGSGGSSDWNNGQIPLFIDAFRRPLLYYAANPAAKAAFTTGSPSGTGSGFVLGRYDQSDNAYMTGTDGSNGLTPVAAQDGWNLTGAQAPGFIHPLGRFEVTKAKVDNGEWPDPDTFQAFVADRNAYDNSFRANTSKGKIAASNPDTFLIISAGVDGLYGTVDDVKNFEVGK